MVAHAGRGVGLPAMTTDSGAIAFAVERFFWPAPERLELSGRWSGVRGIRFVRPTLVLVAGEQHRRVLADLDGKPWPAEEGAPWTCAFPWKGDALDAEAAELTVAPGILIRLDAPELPPGAKRRPRAEPPAEAPADPAPAPAVEAALEDGAPASTLALAGGARGLLQRAADTERAELELAAERVRRTEAEQERDALRHENAALRRERDDLLRLRDEAVRTRNVVTRERDAAAVVRDRLERERAGLVESRDDLRHERDALRRRLEQLERRD
jgi:hypothetical protein